MTLETADGLELTAWWIPARPESFEDGLPPAVLFLPGNAGNRADRLPAANALSEEGLSVLLLEYRGYGGNPGSPSEGGLTKDAQAGLDHLRSRSDVDPDEIIYLGESLGTGVAINLALDEPPPALVLRSPYTSIGAVPAETFRWLPYKWVIRDDFSSIDKIGQVDAPVLVITGSEDEFIPVHQSEEIWEKAGEPKELVIVDGATHVHPAFVDGEEYLSAVRSFVDEWDAED